MKSLLNRTKRYILALFIMLVLSAASRTTILVNGSSFVLPKGWASNQEIQNIMDDSGYRVRSIYNKSTANSRNVVTCNLGAEPLEIDKSALYGAYVSLTSWKELFPNLAIAKNLTLESTTSGKTASGEPLFIGTFSFQADGPWVFQRAYVSYTGEKMLSAVCQAAAMTNLADAKEMMRKNLEEVHLIGKNLAL